MIRRRPGLLDDPRRFRALAGTSAKEFEALILEVGPRFAESERARLEKRNRVRAVGGGPGFGLGLEEQVLLVLARRRHGPTLGALAEAFGVSVWTAIRVIRRIGPILMTPESTVDAPLRGDRERDRRFREAVGLDRS